MKFSRSGGLFCSFLLLLMISTVGFSDNSSNEIVPVDSEEIFYEEFDDDFNDEFADELSDPLESFNRKIFWFNDRVYFYALKPVARTIRLIPEPARVSFANFFSNITSPVRAINAGLQLKFSDVGSEVLRFVINSTVGIFGFFDPAQNFLGLKKKQEDFGQTLGYYGVGSGSYIVLPFYGPSNVRDSVGLAVDVLMDPLFYILRTPEEGVGVKAVSTVNEVSLDKDTYEGIVNDSLDPYIFIMSAYDQNRKAKIDR